MKVFISGAITGRKGYKREFRRAEKMLRKLGHTVINPTILPDKGLDYCEYMHICYGMIDVCDAVYFMKSWRLSDGAKEEHMYSVISGKEQIYED